MTSRRQNETSFKHAAVLTAAALSLAMPALGRDSEFVNTPDGELGAGAPVSSRDLSQASEVAADFDPLALTDEMRSFVEARVSRNWPQYQRLLALQEAIFDPDDGLGITYGSELTRTAAETFRERSGNCLSFTMMFSALARHVGLEPHLVEVDEVTGWSHRGEVDLSHGHMYVEVETEKGVVSIDFLPWTNRRYRSRQRISEKRVKAHYHNNIGADLLTNDEIDRAVERFRLALELAPGFLPARINMAVAYRRSGSTDEAEALLLDVLEEDKANAAAASNLATLYLATGRKSEAQTWLERRDRILGRNPFHHFRRGLSALAGDRPREARTHFRRAIARQRDEGVFYEELAEAHLRLGNPRRARRALRTALDLTTDQDARRDIEQRLNEIVRASSRQE